MASKANEAIAATADIAERKLTSTMAAEAKDIEEPADIEQEELSSDMADKGQEHLKDSRHRSRRVDIRYGRRGHRGARRFHHTSSIFTTQWLLTTHPSITGFSFCTSSSTSSMAVSSKVSQTLFCLLLNVLPVHHAPRPPPARAAHLHCGHQAPQLTVHLLGHHLSLLASHRGLDIRQPSQLGDPLSHHAHRSHLEDHRLHQVHPFHSWIANTSSSTATTSTSSCKSSTTKFPSF